MNTLALDLFGIGSVADAIKAGEWIAAIFAGLAWAVGHPSTAAWAIGAILVLAVLRKGWPFANVPSIDSFPGKTLLIVGLVLIVGGFAWRAADGIFDARSARPTVKQFLHAPGQSHPIPVQRGVQPRAPSDNAPNGG